MYSNEAQMILPGKFGNHFETRVANHSEILLFKRNIVKNGKEVCCCQLPGCCQL